MHSDSNMFRPLALGDLGLGVDAGVAGTGRGFLRLVARGSALEFSADCLDAGGAGTGNLGSVTKVGVDAGEELAGLGDDVLDDDVTLSALLAVTARAIELAEVDNSEAVDRDGTRTVVLDDLILSTGGTTAGDGGITIALEGESVCLVVSVAWRLSHLETCLRRRPPTIRSRWCKNPRSEHLRSDRHR